MTVSNTNPSALDADAILRGLATIQSWSHLKSKTKNQVAELIKFQPIHSLNDIGSIVKKTNLEGRQARSLQTNLSIVVAGLLQGKKPDEIMGNPNSILQLGDYIRRGSHEDVNIASGERYNSRGEPLAVDKMLRRFSR